MKKIIPIDSPFHDLSGFHYEVQRLVKVAYIKNKTVLDIGCGFGWFEYLYGDKGATKIIGLDSSAEVLNEAQRVTKKHKNIKLVKSSGVKLPFKDATFDTVVSWEVLEHIPKNTESQMFSEIYRVLKPDGRLFLSTQYRSVLSTLLDPAWWLVAHRHYTIDKITALATNAGFQVENIYTKGKFFTLINILNMYFSKWILRREPLFINYFTSRVIKEFEDDNGFINIFIQCKKT